MTIGRNSMMYPPLEQLLDRTGSKFMLVTLAAKRGREINSYFNRLGDGLGTIVPPQVASVARKSLSIAFEEIAEGKAVAVPASEQGSGGSGEPGDLTLDGGAHGDGGSEAQPGPGVEEEGA